jgi:hypothetical protein
MATDNRVYKIDPRYGTNDDYVYDWLHYTKKHETRNGLYQSLGNQSLMIKDLPQKTGSISLIPIPKQTKRTTITDIHAAK